jgi:hypothetical protein
VGGHEQGHGGVAGDSQQSPVIRSRLVARDFRHRDKDRQDLFAATPPLEMKRMLISKAATFPANGSVRRLLFIRCKEGPPEREMRAGRVLQVAGGGEPGEGQAREARVLALWVQAGGPGMGEPLLGEVGGGGFPSRSRGLGGILSFAAGLGLCGARRRLHLLRPGRGLELDPVGDAEMVRGQARTRAKTRK